MTCIMSKLRITAQTSHFKQPLGYDDRRTYEIPPVSTIVGMLIVIYGEEILNREFNFGYIYKDGGRFLDDITIYKHREGGGKFIKKGEVQTDCRSIEYNYDAELIIYTDIDLTLKINYILNMGKTNNLATLELPIKKAELVEKKGAKAYNLFTPIDIGTGKISRINMLSRFDNKLNSYNNQTELLRFNKEIELNQNYDEEERQAIFLWKYKEGRVIRGAN